MNVTSSISLMQSMRDPVARGAHNLSNSMHIAAWLSSYYGHGKQTLVSNVQCTGYVFLGFFFYIK